MSSTFTEFDVSDERKLRNSLIGLEDRVASGIYRKSKSCSDFVDASGLTNYFLVGGKALALRYLAGLDADAYTNIRVEDYWVKGKVYIELLYTGSNTTNNYSIDVIMTPVELDVAVDTTSTTITDNAVAPPGTVNFLQSVEFGPYDIDANDKFFTLEVERNGTVDTNSGDFYLMEARIRFYAERV